MAFSVAKRTFWVFTDAWYPLHLRKNPASAPEALMVSVMLIPARVAEASLPSSRICTRVRFTRLAER